jgi:hypothetical protein
LTTKGFHEFFVKKTDALQRVKTPYAMQVDNDDLVACAGTECSSSLCELESARLP